MQTARLLVLVLMLGSLPAQSPPCLSLNDANNNASTNITPTPFFGYTLSAWQFVPPVTTVARSVQLYTGNTAFTAVRHMILEVWAEDPVAVQPLGRLAGGTWRISNALGRAWQGANLDSSVVLQANTPYWLVWHEPGGSMLPTEPGGVTAPAVGRASSATAWTMRPASEIKFRIFCGLLDQQGVQPSGFACAGFSGNLGTTFTNQPPVVGNTGFVVESSGFLPGALAVLVLGVNPGWVSVPLPVLVPSCQQHTDVVVSTFATVSPHTTAGPSGGRYVQFPLGIPNNTALVGTFVAGQVAAIDTGFQVPFPFVASNALRVTVR